MTRLLAALVALILGWFGPLSTAEAASAVWAAVEISDSVVMDVLTLPVLAVGNCSGRRSGIGSRSRSAGVGCCRSPRCRR